MTILLFSLISGCSSFSINPDSKVCKGSNGHTINSYSYSFERREKPFNTFQATSVKEYDKFEKEELYFKAYDELNSATKSLLPNSTFLKDIPVKSNLPHLHISSKYTRESDSCSIMMLSMFTAFLVPMWCTEENFYTLSFDTYIDGKIIKKNTFGIDKNGYVHLLLLPIGLIQPIASSNYEPLSQYKTALKYSLDGNCM